MFPRFSYSQMPKKHLAQFSMKPLLQPRSNRSIIQVLVIASGIPLFCQLIQVASRLVNNAMSASSSFQFRQCEERINSDISIIPAIPFWGKEHRAPIQGILVTAFRPCMHPIIKTLFYSNSYYFQTHTHTFWDPCLIVLTCVGDVSKATTTLCIRSWSAPIPRFETKWIWIKYERFPKYPNRKDDCVPCRKRTSVYK